MTELALDGFDEPAMKYMSISNYDDYPTISLITSSFSGND